MHQKANVVNLQERFYVLSVDRAGEIGASGEYDVVNEVWVQPLQVFGVEEPAGSNLKYSKKTQALLELFKEGSNHFNQLKTKAAELAAEIDERSGYQSVPTDYYYNIKNSTFVSKDDNWDGARYFRDIMKLYKAKSVD